MAMPQDPLEPVQQTLLVALAKQWLGMTDERRRPIEALLPIEAGDRVRFLGLNGLTAQPFDVEALQRAGFIRVVDGWEVWGAPYQIELVVTKEGLDYVQTLLAGTKRSVGRNRLATWYAANRSEILRDVIVGIIVAISIATTSLALRMLMTML